MKSWQADLFKELRRREWHIAGDLFEKYEQAIPLHFATRHYVLAKHTEELPSNFEARWAFFRFTIKRIGVEYGEGTTGPRKAITWNTRIRLGYMDGRVCDDCGGPVIRATWSGATHSCLKCDEPELVTVAPEPVVVTPEPEPVIVTPEPEPRRVMTFEEMGRLSSFDEIWDQFAFEHPDIVKPFPQQSRKLRGMLHRALETGATNEYAHIKFDAEKEFRLLGAPYTTVEYMMLRVLSPRGIEWVREKTPTLSKEERGSWGSLLVAVFCFGAMAVVSITLSGRIDVISDEIERMIAKLPAPKMRDPPRLRWLAPLKSLARWRTK